MAELRIHKHTGQTYHVPHLSDKVTRPQNKQTSAQVKTTRRAISDIDLQQGQDEIEVRENNSTAFRGVLRDAKVIKPEAKLMVDSFEQYSKEAPPTAPKLAFVGATDKEIIEDAIEAVPDLEAGNIQVTSPGIDILYYNASRALQIRRVRDITRGEIRYNSDKTVDYVPPGEFGTDRTSTTISPASQNLTSSRPRERGGGKRFTHLRLIGAGGTTIDVEADQYSSSERERWGRAVFKTVSKEKTLVNLGKSLLAELYNTWLEVKAEIIDISDVKVGDEFTVDYPEQNINNEELRVAELKTMRDENGKRYEATLSNRSFARKREMQKNRDRASQSARAGQTQQMQNSPGANFPITQIPANAAISSPFFVDQNYVFRLWGFGIKPAGSSAPLQPVAAQVIQGNSNTQNGKLIYEEVERTVDYGRPLAQIVGPIGGEVRISNQGDTTVDVGGQFSYTIEREP